MGKQLGIMSIIIITDSFVTTSLAGRKALQIPARVIVMTAERLKGSDRSPGLLCPGVASVPRRGSGSIQCKGVSVPRTAEPPVSDTSTAINSFSHDNV